MMKIEDVHQSSMLFQYAAQPWRNPSMVLLGCWVQTGRAAGQAAASRAVRQAAGQAAARKAAGQALQAADQALQAAGRAEKAPAKASA
mmetsp:Transcript_159693/g.297728  ORF Transcript_159693/g.297728 Transcript_159693/m.297728 type:complete len:88 (+) Transcript_159693:144-407(+)